MIPKAAIDLAISENFLPDHGYFYSSPNWAFVMALTPKFWQCLGKAKGWPSEDGSIPIEMTFGTWEIERPTGRALQFCRLILTGGDVEAYWNEILKV